MAETRYLYQAEPTNEQVDAMLEGMPGTEPYSYEEFSRDCDRHDGKA